MTFETRVIKRRATTIHRGNVGVVPLFNAYGEYPLSERWRAIFDFDGLVGPSGRAFDIGVKAAYGLTRDLSIEGGHRMLEGGAAGRAIAELVASVKGVTDVMAQISAASREQEAGIKQVNQAVMQMDPVTQHNAALVEQSASAAEGPRRRRIQALTCNSWRCGSRTSRGGWRCTMRRPAKPDDCTES